MRFYDSVGYLIQEEDPNNPGVMLEHIVEHKYFGEVIKNGKRDESSPNLIDDISLDNEFSIIADKFARDFFHAMKYIVFYGVKWRISSVDASSPPRMRIRVNGVYNGPEQEGGYGPQSTVT